MWVLPSMNNSKNVNVTMNNIEKLVIMASKQLIVGALISRDNKQLIRV